ncbi:hypothetical protein Ct61P_14544 [Colletotrichum tofieldiae]|nr:hypothetical protein Ct61P_14544 [Colletotrichum tofieldiae]
MNFPTFLQPRAIWPEAMPALLASDSLQDAAFFQACDFELAQELLLSKQNLGCSMLDTFLDSLRHFHYHYPAAAATNDPSIPPSPGAATDALRPRPDVADPIPTLDLQHPSAACRSDEDCYGLHRDDHNDDTDTDSHSDNDSNFDDIDDFANMARFRPDDTPSRPPRHAASASVSASASASPFRLDDAMSTRPSELSLGTQPAVALTPPILCMLATLHSLHHHHPHVQAATGLPRIMLTTAL